MQPNDDIMTAGDHFLRMDDLLQHYSNLSGIGDLQQKKGMINVF